MRLTTVIAIGTACCVAASAQTSEPHRATAAQSQRTLQAQTASMPADHREVSETAAPVRPTVRQDPAPTNSRREPPPESAREVRVAVPIMPAILALTGAIAAAILGAFAKYWWDLRIARRKDKLERVSAQLKQLYGPLYVTDLAAREVWLAFWRKLGRNPQVDEEVPFTEDEDREWRIWVTEVFTPLNERIERTIVENADLLENDGIPPGLLTMCAHIACYKAIRKKWADNIFTENAAPIDYPWQAFREHVVPTFEALKAEQARLLAHKPGA